LGIFSNKSSTILSASYSIYVSIWKQHSHAVIFSITFDSNEWRKWRKWNDPKNVSWLPLCLLNLKPLLHLESSLLCQMVYTTLPLSSHCWYIYWWFPKDNSHWKRFHGLCRTVFLELDMLHDQKAVQMLSVLHNSGPSGIILAIDALKYDMHTMVFNLFFIFIFFNKLKCFFL
jgi:hypothetical protein